MSYADCPDKRCVKQGASDMFPIICLPNHVVVEIKTSGGKKQFLLY
ncbi:MAG TPA: NusG domain II-containing protein [Candidatus Cloacimonadota bacterium]|nr:NusG domain II-containing protein [Candidatus Cloacimonadota bacterium]